MDSSANEALIIGMNVFVFVIALSGALMLMTTVLDMSEAANAVIKDTSGSSLMELYGDGEKRLYTGTELLALSEKYNSSTFMSDGGDFNTSGIKEKYYLEVDHAVSGGNKVELGAITKTDLTKKFSLEYKGKVEEEGNEKLKYVFKEVDI